MFYYLLRINLKIINYANDIVIADDKIVQYLGKEMDNGAIVQDIHFRKELIHIALIQRKAPNKPIELIGSFDFNTDELRYEIDIHDHEEYVCLSYVSGA